MRWKPACFNGGTPLSGPRKCGGRGRRTSRTTRAGSSSAKTRNGRFVSTPTRIRWTPWWSGPRRTSSTRFPVCGVRTSAPDQASAWSAVGGTTPRTSSASVAVPARSGRPTYRARQPGCPGPLRWTTTRSHRRCTPNRMPVGESFAAAEAGAWARCRTPVKAVSLVGSAPGSGPSKGPAPLGVGASGADSADSQAVSPASPTRAATAPATTRPAQRWRRIGSSSRGWTLSVTGRGPSDGRRDRIVTCAPAHVTPVYPFFPPCCNLVGRRGNRALQRMSPYAPSAASTTARASSCTCARCSGPRNDSA